MKIPSKRILQLAMQSHNLMLKVKDKSNEVGDILEKIHPNLEEQLRSGYSFLDQTMDYAEGDTSKEEIERQIKEALDKVSK